MPYLLVQLMVKQDSHWVILLVDLRKWGEKSRKKVSVIARHCPVLTKKRLADTTTVPPPQLSLLSRPPRRSSYQRIELTMYECFWICHIFVRRILFHLR